MFDGVACGAVYIGKALVSMEMHSRLAVNVGNKYEKCSDTADSYECLPGMFASYVTLYLSVVSWKL